MWHSHVTPPPSLWPCEGSFSIKKKIKFCVLGGPWGVLRQGSFSVFFKKFFFKVLWVPMGVFFFKNIFFLNFGAPLGDLRGLFLFFFQKNFFFSFRGPLGGLGGLFLFFSKKIFFNFFFQFFSKKIFF